MKEKLPSERLNELARLYLIEYGMLSDSELETNSLQQLAIAANNGVIRLDPLEAGFVKSDGDRFRRELLEDPLVAQTFVVKTQAELAQFLSALHEAINDEWQSRLNAFIPDQALEQVERDNTAGC